METIYQANAMHKKIEGIHWSMAKYIKIKKYLFKKTVFGIMQHSCI